MDNFTYFMGRDGFVWWIGVVEDRDDPDLIGRVRVRCLGYHTHDLEDIATDDLPWAHVILPPTAPYGAVHNLTPGMWVMGFWRDPQSMQEPVVIGVLPGFPSKGADPSRGFSDPYSPGTSDSQNAKYKIEPDYGPYPTRVGEQDTSRLARGRTEPHLEIAERDALSVKDVKVPKDKQSGFFDFGIEAKDGTNTDTSSTVWKEPKTEDSTIRGEEATGKNPETLLDRVPPYKRRQTEYPYNRVYESESGHIIEIDDTPYAERLYHKHRTGTFTEWDSDGNAVTRVVGNNYTIVAGADFVNVKGDVNLTIDSNCKTFIGGDWEIYVEGNKKEYINGQMKQEVAGEVSETYKATKTETVDGNVTENYKSSKSEEVGGSVTENYKSNQNTKVGSTRKLEASSQIDMDAGTINLN